MNDKKELFKEIEMENQTRFLTQIASAIKYPLPEPEMNIFVQKYEELNKEDKYRVFKVFLENELSYYDDNLDMGWFKFFVTELKLETGSNDVKDGGKMFFYDILELSDNNKKIIKTLINYLDLKKEYEYDLLTRLDAQNDNIEEDLEILKLMKENDMDSFDMFAIVAYNKVSLHRYESSISECNYLNQMVFENSLLNDLDLESNTKFQILMLNELVNAAKSFDNFLTKKHNTSWIIGSELDNVNESISSYFEYNNVTKEILENCLLNNTKDLFNVLEYFYEIDSFNEISNREDKINNPKEEMIDLKTSFLENPQIKNKNNLHCLKNFMEHIGLDNKQNELIEIIEQSVINEMLNKSNKEKYDKINEVLVTKFELELNTEKDMNKIAKTKNKL